MELSWILGGFFILVILVFIAIALLLPEWVGITGHRARLIMKEQQGHTDDVPADAASPETAPLAKAPAADDP